MVLGHGLCNTTWWFYGTCYYISSQKGSFCDKKKRKRQESSRKRLDRLAKGAFFKVGSMEWDVWIHACSHIFLGCGYRFEGFHDYMQWYFYWMVNGYGCFWRLGFSLNEGFPGYILCHFFVGMLSILLHVDFNSIFILDLWWVMWKWLYSLLSSFLTLLPR